jgi:hypothetical protein
VIHGASAANAPPTADFTMTAAERNVSFTDTSIDSDGTVASHAWTFGDGATSTQANPTHTYANYEAYTITLTVTDDDGSTSSFSRTARLYAPPIPLVNGVTVPNLAAPQNEELRYSLAVPAGATNLSFVTNGAAGEDADLTVTLDGDIICESAGATADESCETIETPQAGTYLVSVLAYSSLSDQSILGSYEPPDRIFEDGFD